MAAGRGLIERTHAGSHFRVVGAHDQKLFLSSTLD